MATLLKPTRPYPLPPNAETVTRNGRLHVRVVQNGKPTFYPVTKDGKKYLKPAKRWYVEYRDANGTLRRAKGFTDRKATEQLARELERKAERMQAGLHDPADDHARRPLTEHLKDYAAYLEAKGNTTEHVQLTIGRISALLSGCGFVFPLDCDAGKASEWLNSLRRDSVPLNLPMVQGFTPGETAKLLGITTAAIRATIKRLKLPATGHGKARVFPRATVEAIAANRAKGCGPETVNHYVRAVRGFFRWLVASKRMGSNPLDSLSLVNSAVDVRRARRELTADELRRLFASARASHRSYRGLSGNDRYTLYLLAAGSGFRASALANLTPADFDLNSESPTVTLPARFAKNRRTKVQPLPSDVAIVLREYLTGKPANSPIWGGTWARDHRGAEMLRLDLQVAEIPYAVDGPDGPEYADFHSLRHSYLTLGGRSGIDLRTLQELAGHSKPELTARYSHRRLNDLAGAVAKLPNLVDVESESSNSDAVPDAVTGGATLHESALMNTFGMIGEVSEGLPQPLEMKQPDTVRHQVASVGIKLPGLDSNQDKENQNLLCYRYTTG